MGVTHEEYGMMHASSPAAAQLLGMMHGMEGCMVAAASHEGCSSYHARDQRDAGIPRGVLPLGIPASDRYNTMSGVPLGPAIYPYTSSVSRSRGSHCPSYQLLPSRGFFWRGVPYASKILRVELPACWGNANGTSYEDTSLPTILVTPYLASTLRIL